MNILIFSWRDHKHPQAGGAEQVMREHIKGWVAVGHKITLFSSRFTGSKKHEFLEGIEMIHSGDQYIGVKIEAFKFWLKNGNKFDLVVDQFHGIPFFTTFYVKKPKLAVLQEVAREVWFLNGFSFPVNYIIGLIGYLAEPFIFLFYRNVPFMVGSKSARDDLIKMMIPEKNVTIIPHGVIVPKLKSKVSRGKTKTIIFLGALTKDKGVEDAIRTFAILENMGEYKFWIVGKGGADYISYLKRLAKKLGVLPAIKFWGFVDQKKKFELLAKAHVLLNTSVREGWGLVNIEANSVGTPVVSYNSPGLVDSVNDNVSGIIVRDNTPGILAREVDNLLADQNKFRELQESSVVWSRNFSWAKSCKLSIALIEKTYQDEK